MPSARFDAARGAVHATVEIAAPPERVFRALTDPRELAAWWGSDDTYRSHDWQIDARPGGAWSARTTDANGRVSTVRGEFIVVEPPRLLEYTWLASWDGFAPTTIRCELVAVDVGGTPGTRLTLVHGGFGGRTHAAKGMPPGGRESWRGSRHTWAPRRSSQSGRHPTTRARPRAGSPAGTRPPTRSRRRRAPARDSP
jgi:uncharacterized protein YndB with AHSA1/START domain